MKLIIAFLVTFVIAGFTHAAILPLKQCKITELILAHHGKCPGSFQGVCVDFCTGENIDDAETCLLASHCCWTAGECLLKTTIQTYANRDENEKQQSEGSLLRRMKRQTRGGVEGSIENDRYGTTFSGRVNQNIGRNGNAFVEGKYHHPSNAWQARGGYEHTLPNDGRVSLSGSINSYGTRGLSAGYSGRAFGGRLGASVNANSRGGSGASVQYSRKFQGGQFGVGASVQRDAWGRTSPTFGLSFSKRFGR